MRVLALYSVKGGVGKTTTAVNLATLSALQGRRTLLFDLDPQGAATWMMEGTLPKGIDARRMLKGKDLKERLISTRYRNLSLWPNGPELADLALEMAEMKHAESRLSRLLEKMAERFDEVVIDCPPGLGLLAENVFHAATELLVPVIPAPLALRAAQQVREALNKRNRPPEMMAFLSMVDRRRALHRHFMEQYGDQLPGLILERVPASSEIERQAVTRVPLVYSSPRSTAAQAYLRLWRSIHVPLADC